MKHIILAAAALALIATTANAQAEEGNNPQTRPLAKPTVSPPTAQAPKPGPAAKTPPTTCRDGAKVTTNPCPAPAGAAEQSPPPKAGSVQGPIAGTVRGSPATGYVRPPAQ